MEGDRRGRTIGFPTANLGLGEYLRPAFGVYAVQEVAGDGADDPFAGRWIDGVAGIGLRPTAGTPEPRLEANLFDIDADLYGSICGMRWSISSGPSAAFRGIDVLKAQIAEDAARSRAILAAAPAGVWSGERSVESALIRPVRSCGMRFTFPPDAAALSVPGDLLLSKTTTGMILALEVWGILGLSKIKLPYMHAFVVLLTATIDPGQYKPDLTRYDPAHRLSDYKQSLLFWEALNNSRFEGNSFLRKFGHRSHSSSRFHSQEFKTPVELIGFEGNKKPSNMNLRFL